MRVNVGKKNSRSGSHSFDVRALEAELKEKVRGEVRFDEGYRAAYSTDSSNYRQTPLGVVVPRDPDDVVASLAVCRRYKVPVTPRGAGPAWPVRAPTPP
jgi:FAD/FMN-containing dehydrogenase